MSENINRDYNSDKEDAELYAYMKANFLEGQEFVSEEEKEAFMRKHGIGKYRTNK